MTLIAISFANAVISSLMILIAAGLIILLKEIRLSFTGPQFFEYCGEEDLVEHAALYLGLILIPTILVAFCLIHTGVRSEAESTARNIAITQFKEDCAKEGGQVYRMVDPMNGLICSFDPNIRTMK